MTATPSLNEKAWRLADHMAATAAALRVKVNKTPKGSRLIDCGVDAQGGLQAGLAMSRICLAGQAEVSLTSGDVAGIGCPYVQVSTDTPILACMASQYAGWQISVGNFFALGSGPMRALHAKEALFNDIPGKEQSAQAVGVLETRKLPGDDVFDHLTESLQIPAEKVTLVVAPAPSIAGTMQVVARSIETALHKMHELKFDINQVVAGFGSAPLPPIARDDLGAIGRTNDSILYGARVTLWLEGEDEQIADLGPKIPSNSSPDYGAPFATIFQHADMDFYKIDPMLFSPAEVVLHNLKSGRGFVFGRTRPEILHRSFFDS